MPILAVIPSIFVTVYFLFSVPFFFWLMSSVRNKYIDKHAVGSNVLGSLNTFTLGPSLIFLILFSLAGFDVLLFLIPGSWGGLDEYAEFISRRSQLSTAFGLVTGVFMAWTVTTRWETERKNRIIRDEIEYTKQRIEKRKAGEWAW